MKKRWVSALAALLTVPLSLSPVSAMIVPTLRYQNGGASFEYWTEEGYYNSPVIYDLDGDGKNEIIFSNYSITVINEEDGSIDFHVYSGYDRSTPFTEESLSVGNTWCDAFVGDINGDASPEIVTVHGSGLVSVLDKNGYFVPGFPVTPAASPARSLVVEDLDGDGTREIIVGYGTESHVAVHVLNCDGRERPGWPQLSDENAGRSFGYGVFMNGIAADDIDGDGKKEIIVPTDTSYISAFRHDGSLVMANEEVYGDRAWGKVALYEDYRFEIRGDNGGWGFDVTGNETREQLYKAEFGHGIAVIEDVDGDGKKEILVSGIMCNRKYAPTYPPTEYMTVCILNADRTRYRNAALDADWTVLPTDRGKPLFQNTVSIASAVYQKPVVADLDGDGMNEVLFNSYNGRVECFSLNKKEPYAWPFSLTKRSSPLFEYASPVVCRDLDGDGKQEVIFTSFYDTYGQNPGIIQGHLYILNYEGNVLYKTVLPKAKEADYKINGAAAAPVVEDIDGDGRYEIVVNTSGGAIAVYDL